MTSLLVHSVAVFLLCVLLPEATEQQQQLFTESGPPDECLAGPFHKSVPSPEEETFDECLSWQNKACCNTEVPAIIDNHKAVGLYNYTWDLCGTLSQTCEAFIKNEECFYQCEPMLGHFETSPGSGYISHVPVCASYCNEWFEACKDDLTCVEDWLEDFDYAKNGANTCPANSACIPFKERYGDAEGLCNRMWGNAFFYSEDADNCTVMAFDPSNPNPNFRLTFPVAGSVHVMASVMCVAVMLAMSYLI